MNVELLKAKILDLAIHGKLVPQLDSEPAVEQIGEFPDDIPFEIPEKCKGTSLGLLINQHKGGGTPARSISTYWNGNIPWASVKDLKGDFLYQTQEFITEEGLKNSAANLIPANNIIVCMRMALGKICINKIDIAINQDLRALLLKPIVDKYFFLSFYKTQEVSGNGITVKGIKIQDLLSTNFPLPPIEEQHRIVAKIKELFSILDIIEAKQKSLEEKLKLIKTKALDLAIHGKLVPQLDSEPAVEQIDEAPDEIPFEIPEKWKWVLASKCISLKSGQDLPKNLIITEKGALPYITGASQFSKDNKLIINRWTNNPTAISDSEDILITCKGTVGKIAINSIGKVHIARQLMAIKVNDNLISNQFMELFLQRQIKTIEQKARGIIPGIKRQDILNIKTPLPPIEEQHRIVAKINEIFSFCDKAMELLHK